MGILLDSTALIGADRRGTTAVRALRQLTEAFPDAVLAVSVISLMEFAHGTVRAENQGRMDKRSRFLDQFMALVEIHPVSTSIALRAGRLDAHLAQRGISVAFADLLIGATALELGYSILTSNLRHFERIPDLHVLKQ